MSGVKGKVVHTLKLEKERNSMFFKSAFYKHGVDLQLICSMSIILSVIGFYKCYSKYVHTLHIRQRPHGIKNLDNQIYGLIIKFMASRHVYECEIEYLVVKKLSYMLYMGVN